MNSIAAANEIQDLGTKQGGVLTSIEIDTILQKKYPRSLYLSIRNLEKAGVLRRFSRNMYVTKSFDPYVLFQKLNPNSYISFENVLYDSGLIGTGSKYRVRGVKLGRTRTYNGLNLRLEYMGIQEDLLFGFEVKNGIRKATPEKAFLDCAYYYLRGAKFTFDIFSDVNIEDLDTKKIKTYLKAYKNLKFKTFFRKLYEGYQ